MFAHKPLFAVACCLSFFACASNPSTAETDGSGEAASALTLPPSLDPLDLGGCPGDTTGGYGKYAHTVTYTCTGNAEYLVGNERDATVHASPHTVTLTQFNADGTSKDRVSLLIGGAERVGIEHQVAGYPYNADVQLDPSGGTWLRVVHPITLMHAHGKMPVSCSKADRDTDFFFSTTAGTWLSCTVRVSGRKL